MAFTVETSRDLRIRHSTPVCPSRYPSAQSMRGSPPTSLGCLPMPLYGRRPSEISRTTTSLAPYQDRGSSLCLRTRPLTRTATTTSASKCDRCGTTYSTPNSEPGRSTFCRARHSRSPTCLALHRGPTWTCCRGKLSPASPHILGRPRSRARSGFASYLSWTSGRTSWRWPHRSRISPVSPGPRKGPRLQTRPRLLRSRLCDARYRKTSASRSRALWTASLLVIGQS